MGRSRCGSFLRRLPAWIPMTLTRSFLTLTLMTHITVSFGWVWREPCASGALPRDRHLTRLAAWGRRDYGNAAAARILSERPQMKPWG